MENIYIDNKIVGCAENTFVEIKYLDDFMKELFNNKEMVSVDDLLNKIYEMHDDMTELELKTDDLKHELEDEIEVRRFYERNR